MLAEAAMSLYKRGGVWWYDFDVNGTRIRESTGLLSRSSAARAEALRKAELIRNPGREESWEPAPQFDEFALKGFAEYSQNQHREHPSAHERYLRSVKVLIRFFGQRTLDSIFSGDVERFKIIRSRERRKNARDGRTVTPAAVNRDLAVLRILFNLAMRMRKAKSSPVAGVKLLPEHNLQRRVLSWEEGLAYLAAASQPLRDVAMLMLETGLRPGEVFHLRKGDVNLELGFLRIPAGKTAFARRTIPLMQLARAVLATRILRANSEWLFPAPNNVTRPLSSMRKAHEATFHRSRIKPHFRFYDLRHTALTRMAMAGVDLPTLRELAGHASVQMTMRYVHPTPDHKKNAVRKLEAFCAAKAEHISSGDSCEPVFEAQISDAADHEIVDHRLDFKE
jgi:integrase